MTVTGLLLAAFGAPATERSRRTLGLPLAAVQALRAWSGSQAGERLAAGDRWQDTGLVFTNHLGAALDAGNVRKMFKRACTEAGIGDGWTPRELEDAQIKLSSVISDIFGASGRAMLDALIGGQRNPHELAALARGSMRAKASVLTEALTGHFTEHHAFMLAMMLDRIDALTAQIATLTTRIEDAIAPFAAQVAQLDEIPGIGTAAAQDLLAEIGTDMSRFPTARHLVSWAKFAPRARQSAGRSKAATTGQGNPWLGGTIGEAATGAARTKTFLASRYRSSSAAARNVPSSPSATPSWSSPGTYCPIPPPTSPTSGRTGMTGSPRCAANASSSLNSNACPARRSPCTTPPDTARP